MNNAKRLGAAAGRQVAAAGKATSNFAKRRAHNVQRGVTVVGQKTAAGAKYALNKAKALGAAAEQQVRNTTSNLKAGRNAYQVESEQEG